MAKWFGILLSWLTAAPALAADLSAKIVTDLGVIEVKLFDEQAPKTVANFVELAKAHFYDGQIFHRVMPGFSVQMGDPTGKGGGGPGYCIADEFGPGLAHDRPGLLSMVNTAPGANGSQFMITLVQAPSLDRRSPIFGEVSAGLDVAQRIVVGTKVERVEIVGEATLDLPVKTPELTLDQLKSQTRTEVEKILKNLGATMALGSLTKFEVSDARSRCADSQMQITADYQKKAGARLLLYGKSDGKTYRVEQLQWTR